ncbi:MAG: hypothetical protein ACYTFI_14660 [Planctomycetota bacterium]|jgi:hypothetical protein
MMPVRKVSYVDLKVPNRAGQGTQILRALNDAGVNLLAFTGFPDKGGKSQIDLVTNDLGAVRRLARKHGWRISKAKKGFLIQGRDRVGAVYRQVRKLADQKINVTAVDAVAAGKGQFGMILWVKPKDYVRAARALRAR